MEKEKTISLFGVEYNSNEQTTFEIFRTREEAKKFADEMCDDALYMFVADFDEALVYEEDGRLNYDDGSGIYTNLKMLECYVCNGDCLKHDNVYEINNADMCELAHELTINLGERLGVEVEQEDENGDMKYTEKGQEYFNYFHDTISNILL